MDRAWADLGLSPGASQDSIKQAYRKLVLQYHPDRHASSSIGDQEAAAARFKVITEAYDLLTDERARAAYHTSSRSSSSAGAYSYHHNVNTDWSQSHYQGGSSSGYTSRMSRWDWYRRFASAGVRSFSQTFHVGLAVLLIGGGLVFEFSHTAIWQARNRGKSFEEMQQAIRAQQESKAASTNSSTAATGSSATGSSSSIDGSNKAGHISSAWADGMRGRFVSADSSSDHKT